MAFLPFLISFLLISFSKCDDQLIQAKKLYLGDVLVSEGGVFALGLFSPTISNNSLFLGIWYNNISERTYVWVANRNNPITAPSSAMLAIKNNSNLVLSDSKGQIIWTTNSTVNGGNGAYAKLLDSGNLVVQLPNRTTIWQSFDYPTDTLLPNMKFWMSYKEQVVERLVAWKSPDDPSTGDFSCSGDPSSNFQAFIWHGTRPYYRFIVLDSVKVSGAAYGSNKTSFMYQTIVNTEDAFYVTFTTSDGSPYAHVTLDYMGTLRFMNWNGDSSSWTIFTQRPMAAGYCDIYASCGPFSYCDLTLAVPSCQCLDGFEPDTANSSRGCRRMQELRCGDGIHFVTIPGMKVPDKFLHVQNKSFDECEAECSRNCSCTAYAYSNLTMTGTSGNIAGQSRCLLWVGELVDTARASLGDNLYLRLPNDSPGKQRNNEYQKRAEFRTSHELFEQNLEFPFVEFEEIVTATNNFCDSNMLGKGGFGNVYKHKNLVRLLGFCIHGEEKLLIYEYLPNKSLDYFLFDDSKKSMLDWQTRFNIIKGVARGLVYLHQDSRMTIIHRDLKASNILLDEEMSPKISDFGIARIFGGNQHQENTRHVVGTYGYMSPEYAMEGIFSVKSDTYSFGVLVLELISGAKICSPHLIMDFPNLIACAWSLWKDGKAEEFVDSIILESYSLNEFLLCIHVGLLCVQEDPDARPLMSSVVAMFENEATALPTPKQPAYFVQRNFMAERAREDADKSMNSMSLTALQGPLSYDLEYHDQVTWSSDKLTPRKPLFPSEMLISKGGVFALGFFSPANSSNSLYVGIWFHNIPQRTVVWVANRDNPITTPSSATLAITNSSGMVLLDSQGHTLWMTKIGVAGASAVLLDTGNLVLRSPNGTSIWQSFDHPTDTILAGMMFLMSYKSQIVGRLTAWRSPDDPSTGDFSFSLDPSSDLQGMTWNGTKPYCRNGIRTSMPVSGAQYPSNNSLFMYQTLIDSGNELYYSYTVSDGSMYTRLTLDSAGAMMFLSWDNSSSSWTLIFQRPTTGSCEVYTSCGPFGYCDFTGAVPACRCLDGFKPVDPSISQSGCQRKEALRCGEGSHHFVSLPDMKVPDKFLHIRNRSFDQCAAECSSNCSCKAYAYANLSGSGTMADPSRCLVWTGELVDSGKKASLGENLYLRLADPPGKQNKEIQKRLMLEYPGNSNELGGENVKFPFISFEDIVAATDNFCEYNLLGRGGFGKVYKGILEGGTEVAVKRLNEGSGQGIEEFRNEVVLIAKLQHRNLVRLLGCCIHEDEKLLIYEYLPNKSLDAFLFEMNPKISDFGIARIFHGNKQQANTTRVVGTYGYMSPAYVLGGAFSVKSDTYSFGVLLLEIVSGLKISSSKLTPNFFSLIAYAWRLWKDGNATELLDKFFVDSYPLHEAFRKESCIWSYGSVAKTKGANCSPFIPIGKPRTRPNEIYQIMACLPVFIYVLLLISFCKGDDQLTQAKRPITAGVVLVSKGAVFALGFFSPTTSNQSLFLGIWYHNISESERTYVWVANRNNPITTPSSAMLAISNSSNLVLSDSGGHTLWTTNITVASGDDRAYAVLLDSGNLVLRLPNGTTIWQSFDHPTDTLLMGMKFLVSYKAQVAMRFIAWKGPDDPSTGNFSISGDPNSNLQVFLWNGTRPYIRFIGFGPNNMWSSVFPFSSSLIYETSVSMDDEFYYMYTTSDGSPYKRLQLDYTGTLKFLAWNDSSSSWTIVFQRPAPAVECDPYASCGPFGYCDATAAIPRSFDECAAECSRNCSCTAYAYANLTGADQARCLLWSGELADTGRATNIGENLYLRLADSTVNKKKSDILKIVLPVITSLLILMCICLAWICKSRGIHRRKEIQKKHRLQYLKDSSELENDNLELPFICLEDIVTATNNFSDHNMLGKGGFGKVYKGVFEGAKEVAVKRLSKGSQQGVEEFRNEVVLIAKLQHRNLVRLIGYCIHEDEKLLIYEYLPNKSLDTFLFDATRKSVLDWMTRFMIIKGIARGLLYLHQDSRLTIIHRDLKASNILLDTNMSPKISDFGMARIFGGNKQQENTTRVVGTYGYMSPEYVLEGSFSVKSDTYSFGVLLLEIAWRLWKDGNAMDLVDSSIRESCLIHEVLRCIQIALSCVQDHPTARPLMSSIVFMLENETASLPTAKEPAYFTARVNGTRDTRENMERSVNNERSSLLTGDEFEGRWHEPLLWLPKAAKHIGAFFFMESPRPRRNLHTTTNQEAIDTLNHNPNSTVEI
uniref:non-specific serine/threonine protein kinase n=1 Tax=Oryza punctata TaxID=4537 RepID=A0A0E0KVN6_ORYPU